MSRAITFLCCRHMFDAGAFCAAVMNRLVCRAAKPGAIVSALPSNLIPDLLMFHSSSDSFFLDYRPADSVKAIYTLSIDSVGEGYLPENFQRVLEVPSDISLLKLHLLVQHVTGFDDEQIDAFYIASSLRGKKAWYKQNGMWVSERQAELSLPIEEIFTPRTNRKLFYLFNFGDRWIFRISRANAEEVPAPDRRYPRVVREKGMKPI
jgi:Plasmid pRiA4b ORF-3-like protein